MNQELYTQFINAATLLLHREACNQKIDELEKEVEHWERQLDKLQKKATGKPDAHGPLLGFGIFFIVLSCLCFIAGIANIVAFSRYGEDQFVLILAIIFVIAITIFLSIACILLLIARIVRKKHQKRYKKEYEIFKSETSDPEIAALWAQVEAVREESAQYWRKNKHYLEFLPKKYHDLDAIGFMLDALEGLRANTLPDVINLYENELRWRMSQQAMALQAIQTQNLLDTMAEIENHQQLIHDDLVSIRINQFIDMINK